MDLAVAPNATGLALVLHRADCPQVRAQASRGDPVMTLFQCAGDPDTLDPRLARCHCLMGTQSPSGRHIEGRGPTDL